MKINFRKFPGVLVPATDMDAEKFNKFKTGEEYPVDIPLYRNPSFHRKMFAFLNFCFEFWKGDNEFECEARQFDVFRNHLTVLAGFYDSFVNINGEVRIEAKSLSYGDMGQEEFEQCYNSMINAAMEHVFRTADENTLSRLIGFF